MASGYANAMQTALDGGITNVQTSITVVSSTGFPTPPFRVRIREEGGNASEICTVTNVAGQTWTVTRASESYAGSSSASSHGSGAIVEHIMTAGLEISLERRLSDIRLTPPTTAPNTFGLDDEFNDGSLDGSWTRVDRSGNSAGVIWTEGGNVLSMYHNTSDNGSEIHAIVKPLGGASYPLTIETATRFFTPRLQGYSYLMAGLVLADGTTYGAGKQIFQMPYDYDGSYGSLNLDTRTYTNYSTDANSSASPYRFWGGTLYQRLKWTGTSTFASEYSIDGVSWYTQRAGLSYSFTPTYAGFGVSTWAQPNGQYVVLASFEYFRVY